MTSGPSSIGQDPGCFPSDNGEKDKKKLHKHEPLIDCRGTKVKNGGTEPVVLYIPTGTDLTGYQPLNSLRSSKFINTSFIHPIYHNHILPHSSLRSTSIVLKNKKQKDRQLCEQVSKRLYILAFPLLDLN